MTYRGPLVKKRNNYGFICYTNHHGVSRDIFVHFDQYLPGFTPETQQICEFELGPSPVEGKPPVAIRVRVVKTRAQVIEEFQRNLELRGGLDALMGREGGAA